MSYAFCVEANVERGMGHLFRVIDFAKYLQNQGERVVVFLDGDDVSGALLEKKDIFFEKIDVTFCEEALIRKYHVRVWINDRLNTLYEHAERVKQNGVILVSFDDFGPGAHLADLSVSPVLGLITPPPGKMVLCGKEYVQFSVEVQNTRRVRNILKSVVVSLGGSDTHGLTVHVVRVLQTIGVGATIIMGPLSTVDKELVDVMDERYCLKRSVPSLAMEFSKHDLAITNGGLTPYQANAAGLPCIVIATELHEIPMGRYLEELGASIFAGFRTDSDLATAYRRTSAIREMSQKGLDSFDFNAAERIYREIKWLEKDSCNSPT